MAVKRAQDSSWAKIKLHLQGSNRGESGCFDLNQSKSSFDLNLARAPQSRFKMLPTHVSAKDGWRSKIYKFLTRKSPSVWSKVVTCYIESLVIVSIILLCMSSFPKILAWKQWPQLHFYSETFITANFLVDLFLKVICSPSLAYIKTWASFFDILSIIPWFFDLMMDIIDRNHGLTPTGVGILRVARFARFFRAAIDEFPQISIFLLALRRSKIALLFLFIYVVGAGLLAALIIFFTETSDCVAHNQTWVFKKDLSTLCSFQHIGDAIWFVIVTMTTVGYGDYTPKTLIGKTVTSLLMIMSVISFALPIAIFGANLTEVYVEQNGSKAPKQKPSHVEPLETVSLSDNCNKAELMRRINLVQTELQSLSRFVS
jgi:potassium voltage-gated channel Shal-related subfamily D protein 2